MAGEVARTSLKQCTLLAELWTMRKQRLRASLQSCGGLAAAGGARRTLYRGRGNRPEITYASFRKENWTDN
jgi:hypothetical protein